MLEKKSFPFEIKATDENGTFEGYASVFGNVDSYGDVIEQGAFTKTIQENKNRIKVLWNHDTYSPIGVPLMMSEDNHGLHVKAKISMTTLGKDVHQLIKDGVVTEMSIGYNTIKDEWDQIAKVRRLKELKLWEFSPVTFAANDQAGITGVKNVDNRLEQTLSFLNNELKAGKVLSDKNKTLVEQCVEMLKSLLQANEAAKSTSMFEEADIKSITEIIDEMKNFGQPKQDEMQLFADFLKTLK